MEHHIIVRFYLLQVLGGGGGGGGGEGEGEAVNSNATFELLKLSNVIVFMAYNNFI